MGDIGRTAGLTVVDVNVLELEVGIAGVLASVIDAVLLTDDLPILGPDLVAALAALDMEDFSHLRGASSEKRWVLDRKSWVCRFFLSWWEGEEGKTAKAGGKGCWD
ncbi:hypothetical protein MLD38_010362 [Melastoma candidum]|uniref:Uncharacterized protein n=1 Tax=Melastoma candidum TaxID=119954 RepID=A0ACB9R050_9MYRT|nr:hypothetical protein MLD38_010362 [Melastoma candidum]